MSENFEAPQSRNEAILQNMLGADNELLPPESRIEVLLQLLLEEWKNLDPSGGGGTEVIANPAMSGDEDELTGLEVDGTNYAVPHGINVVANPTLAGTEAALSGLEVGNTKYKVIGSVPTLSSLLSLSVAGWDASTKEQTVAIQLDTSKRNVIDITIGENQAWDNFGVYPIAETLSGITFKAVNIPNQALTFKVCSMEVS